MNFRLLFKVSAIIEILTGLTFLAAPALIVGLLLGDGINPIGIGVARVLGVRIVVGRRRSLGVSGAGHTPRPAGRTLRLQCWSRSITRDFGNDRRYGWAVSVAGGLATRTHRISNALDYFQVRSIHQQ